MRNIFLFVPKTGRRTRLARRVWRTAVLHLLPLLLTAVSSASARDQPRAFGLGESYARTARFSAEASGASAARVKLAHVGWSKRVPGRASPRKAQREPLAKSLKRMPGAVPGKALARPAAPNCGVRGKPSCPRPLSGPTPQHCPPGTTGRWPMCRAIAENPEKCPPGSMGRWPKCRTIGQDCPRGGRCPGPERSVTLNPERPAGGPPTPAYLASLPRHGERNLGAEITPLPRQVLVLIASSQPSTLEDELARAHRLQRLEGQILTLIDGRMQVYRIPDRRSVETVVSALSRDPRVRLAQNNRRYLRQGETRETPTVLQYALAKIAAPAAHEMALGRGVVVAVIDSEVDAAHPDLKGVVGLSYDAVGPAKHVSDGHGTAVAGIVSGRGTVRGVAPQSRVLAVRAFYATGTGKQVETSSSVLLRAIEWSVTNGANILNMSFVGSRDPAVHLVLRAAHERGVVLIAAAGNGGSKAPPAYPAAYPEVVAVTAVDQTDRRYVHANRGSYIAVSAPGVDILAPTNGGSHAFLSGTSAAAHVSGVVALLLERNPRLGPRGVLKSLTEQAVDLGPPGRDEDFGAGRVDAFASLRAIDAFSPRSGSQ